MQRFSFCQRNNITTENYDAETLPTYTSTLTSALHGLHRMRSSLILSKIYLQMCFEFQDDLRPYFEFQHNLRLERVHTEADAWL